MKTKVKQKPKTREYIINKAADDRILKQFFSPIEVAAYEAEYQPFQFAIEDITFDITDELCQDLIQLHFQRLKHFHEFVSKLIKTKLYSNPKYAKFLLAPLKDHNLSGRLYYRLRCHGFETLSDVLKSGRRSVLKLRGIGEASIIEIEALFKKNGCESLFEYCYESNY